MTGTRLWILLLTVAAVLLHPVTSCPAPDRSFDPGSIPFESDVSQTGAKTLRIPIEAYPGQGGFTPAISLFYDSRNGISEVGRGWGVSGIPCISRQHKSIFHDGDVSAISLDSDDAFSLDGVRMIETGRNPGIIEYETWTGRIKARGVVLGKTLAYFEVFWPDGHKGVFGIKDNQNDLLEYPLTELTDPFGNTIAFSYTNDGENPLPSSIIYGNTRRIDFEYSDNPNGPLGGWCRGVDVSRSKLLSSISCRLGSETLCVYSLDYDCTDDWALLRSVGYSAGNVRYNPLRFQYGTGKTDDGSPRRHITLPSNPDAKPETIIHTQGNFIPLNGGGFAEYESRNPYRFHQRASDLFHHSEYRFVNDYSGNEDIQVYADLIANYGKPFILKTESGFTDLLCADPDGDGNDCLIRVNNTVCNGLDQLSFTTIGIKSDSGVATGISKRTYSTSFPTVYTDHSGYSSVQPKHHYTGDFDGDGRDEILTVFSFNPIEGVRMPSRFLVTSIEESGLCVVYDSPEEFPYKVTFYGEWLNNPAFAARNSDHIITADFDGDGKCDILHIRSGGADLYGFDTSGAQWVLEKKGYTNLIWREAFGRRAVFCGDFNGDGIADVLLPPPSQSDSEPYWQVVFSYGNGRFDSEAFTGPYYDLEKWNRYLAADYDGDGRTDLVFCEGGTAKVFLSDPRGIPAPGLDLVSVKPDCRLIAVQGTGGSPQTLASVKGNEVVLYGISSSLAGNALLTECTGSLGATEKISYAVTDHYGILKGVYSTGKSVKFPYIHTPFPIPVVASDKVFCSNVLESSRRFSYVGAVFNRNGLGFCGFSSVRITDALDRETVSDYEPCRLSVLVRQKDTSGEKTWSWSVDARPGKTAKAHPVSSKETVFLENNLIERWFSYDVYGFRTNERSDYQEGYSTISSFRWKHNPDAWDGYFLGLPLRETQVVTVPDGRSAVSAVEYGAFLHTKPLSWTKSKGNTTVERHSLEYDSHGNTVSETQLPWNSKCPLTLFREYDDEGRLVKTVDAEGRTETFGYDTRGNISSKTDIAGNRTLLFHDGAGRCIFEKRADGTEAETVFKWASPASHGVVSVTRNETGRASESTVSDALGRTVVESHAGFDGNPVNVETVYCQEGLVSLRSLPFREGETPRWTEYFYDDSGRKSAEQTYDEFVTEYDYGYRSSTERRGDWFRTETRDPFGNVVSVSDPKATVCYKYDAFGNIIESGPDSGPAVSYDYDNAGRLVESSHPSFGSTACSYDEAGRIASETNADGRTVTYEYDSKGKLLRKKWLGLTVTYAYDALGRLFIASTDGGLVKTREYDTFGRIAAETETGPSHTWLRKDFSYEEGNVSRIMYSTHRGFLLTEKMTWVNGKLAVGKIEKGETVYRLVSENVFGMPVETEVCGQKRQYGYTPSGFPESRKITFGDKTLLDFSYSHDHESGNMLCREDNVNGTAEYFSYDDAGRLTGFGDTAMCYDSFDNVSECSPSGIYVHSLPSNPYAITAAGLTGTTMGGENGMSLEHSSFDRVISIAEGEFTADFEYGPDLDRVGMSLKKDGKEILSKTTLGGCYDEETTPGGSVQRLWLFGGWYGSPAVWSLETPTLVQDTLSSVKPFDPGPYVPDPGTAIENSPDKLPELPDRPSLSAKIYLLGRDVLGSVTHIFTPSGLTVAEYSYDPWGRMRDPASLLYPDKETVSPMFGRGFTGHEHLPHFGLVNMNARLYDPLTCCFLSPDPECRAPGSGQGFNPYAYCLNNPLKYVDENGESFWAIVGIAAVIGGIANVGCHFEDLSGMDTKAAFLKGLQYAAVGAVAAGVASAVAVGAATALSYTGVFGAAGYSAVMSTAWGGAITGAVEGYVNGFLLESSNSLIDGSTFKEAMKAGDIGALWGAATGVVSGAIFGSIDIDLPQKKYTSQQNTGPPSLPDLDCKFEPGKFTVYYGYDDNNTIRYIGITKRDPEIRFQEHLRSKTERANLHYMVKYNGISKLSSHIAEQSYINMFGLRRNGGQLYNKINSISPNWWELHHIKP